MLNEAQVVIIGGGIIGASVAYHLTKLGVKEVVLLERKQLTCGTTWHAAGLVPQLRHTYNMSMLAKYGTDLFSSLELETGQATGFKRCGSLTVATTEQRLIELKRGVSMARYCGFEANIITPEQAAEMWPLLNIGDVIGAIYLPEDGVTNPTDTTQALAKAAKMGGTEIIENCEVKDVLQQHGKVTGVATSKGDISAPIVVNCSGMWARTLAQKSSVNIPLHASEHFYVVTENMPGLDNNLPVLRDQDNCNYFKEDAGKLLVGTFEPNAKPWGMSGIPQSFCFDQLPEDIEHLEPYLEAAMHRIPKLAETGLQLIFNGPESFTPDDHFQLGEAPELSNYFVAAGFNSIGIQSAGGAGKMLAEKIVNGYASIDLSEVDIRRNMPFQGNSSYLHDRTTESLGLLYAMHWPFRQYETARNVRKSVLHDRLLEHNACFGEVSGWERPNWFSPKEVKAEYEYSYGRQNWFEHSAAEHQAVREQVGLFDQSSFTKFLLQGSDAVTVLNRICCNNIDVPVGRLVYTQWLNERGGIEADLTVTRLSDNQFMIVTGAATQTRDFHWLKSHIPKSSAAWLSDITSGYVVLGLMGPNSRLLLSELSHADLSNEAFPFATSKEIELGYTFVRASRITYVGELGWELYIQTEYAQSIFDLMVEKGQKYGLKLAGFHALNSLRMEKGYRHWGHDITDEDNLLQGGLSFTADLTKEGGFIGKDALMQQKEQGVKRRLVQFLFQSPDPMSYYNEPIYRNGDRVGFTTSGMFGHTLGACVAMGYVSHDEVINKGWIESGKFEIEIACKKFPVKASLRGFYDLQNKKIRC